MPILDNRSYPTTPDLVRRFETQVDRDPDGVAVAFESQTVGYRELDQRANRLAHRLRRLGVGPETLVALSAERSVELVVGILGILKAGGAYLPLDPAYPSDRLTFMLQDSGAKILVTHHAQKEPPRAQGLQVVYSEDVADEADTRVGVELAPDNLAYVIYTSGSTGRPKGVPISHGNVVRLFEATDDWFHFSATDVWTLFHSYAFDFSVWELWGALLYGGKLVVVPYWISRSPDAFYELLSREHVTVLNQTPSAFRQLVHAATSGTHRPLDLRYVVFGGEALELQGLRPWFERFGDQQPRLINMYGITETTVHVTYRPLSKQDVEQGLGSVIGVPIPDLRVQLVDDKLQPVSGDTPGEIVVHGAGLSRGYLNREELTAERFVTLSLDGQPVRAYRSGDLARWTASGDLEYLGRIDHQVKIRGFRIELGEIESAIALNPAVREVAVIVREDVPGDKRLVAYLSLRGDASVVDAIRTSLRERLPDYMVPAAFVVLPTLPLTENGKTDRRALPAPDAKRPELETEFVEPDGALEVSIAGIWQRLLRIDRVGANDSFFDLGGSSLLAVETLMAIRRELGRSVPVVALFQHPTVRTLARSLGGDAQASVALGAIQARAAHKRAGSAEPIAIIGMAGRFPGARDVHELWRNLCAGVESVRFFRDDEIDARVDRSDPAYVKARGIIEDADKFDASFFGEPKSIAEMVDPQQRVILELAWHALEDAGVVPDRHGGIVGVYAGTGHNTYLTKNVVHRPDRIAAVGELQMTLGNDKDFVATRIAHKLNLTGPALSLHTACSTSLVATCVAVRGLQEHDCDIALAGAASITIPQMAGHVYSEGAMLSSDGHTRTFDAAATGTVFSDGAGMIVLKRLSDAKRDGDRIYAVIRGAAINNDGGQKASYTAPSVSGQAAVIAAAHALADVDPRSISYVETHGTATPLGDPVEVEALTQAFRARTQDRGFCAIGSVKSNIGHLTASSGVAGVIKTALALYHRKLPPSLHFEKPNPNIDFTSTPFFVQTKLTDWTSTEGTPRRAGVSSFGVGGTNAHLVLEEAPAALEAGPKKPAQVLPLSARTPEALDRLTAAIADFVETHPDLDLADLAYTLQTRRTHFSHRRFVTCASREEALTQLRAGSTPGKRVERSTVDVVCVFPGQGSQYVGMGRALYEVEPVFRKTIDDCATILTPQLGRDLRELIFASASDAEAAKASLFQTQYTQPAIFSLAYALASLWQSWGINPVAMVGHSVGEFVAATLSGVFAFEDALRLVAERAKLMQALPPGTMLSVRASASTIEPRLPGALALAAANSPTLSVVSGPKDEIEAFRAVLEAEGLPCRPLFTSHAFHSAMVEPAIQPFAEVLARVKLAPPRIPIVSTVTGAYLTDEQATDPQYWARHMRVTVRFMDAIRTAWADPSRVLLEVGPRRTSATLATQIAEDRTKQVAIASLDDRPEVEWQSLSRALGQLWLAGVPLDWEGFHASGRRNLLSIPHYPFARDRHWLEPKPAAGDGLAHVEGPPATPPQALQGRQDHEASPTIQPGAVGRTLLGQLQIMQAQLHALASGRGRVKPQ
jgi:amino acid adenylation domain-containing protein